MKRFFLISTLSLILVFGLFGCNAPENTPNDDKIAEDATLIDDFNDDKTLAEDELKQIETEEVIEEDNANSDLNASSVSVDLSSFEDSFYEILNVVETDNRQAGTAMEMAQYSGDLYQMADSLLQDIVAYLQASISDSEAIALDNEQSAFEVERKAIAQADVDKLGDPMHVSGNSINMTYSMSLFEQTISRVADLLGLGWDYWDYQNSKLGLS